MANSVENSPGATLELVGKAVAAAGVVIYVCGFLIVSLHQSKYGFTETNPFRSRIVSAGALFVFFTVVPVLLWTRTRSSAKDLRGILIRIFPYYAICYFFGSGLSSLLTVPTDLQTFAIKLMVLFFFLFFFFVLAVVDDRSDKVPRWIVPSLSIILFVYFLQGLVRQLVATRQFQRGALPLWFLGIGLATELIYQSLSGLNFKGFKEKDWVSNLSFFLLVLFLFANYYYPNIKASWGGGEPISVVMWFKSESAVKPGQQVAVKLLDESDVGFYILGRGEKNAVFIPRSAVSAVYYSDKVSDSALLQK
jgi:hypothetical protein